MITFTKQSPLILFIGDLLVLLAFVFIGQRDHGIDDSQPVVRLVTTTAYFLVPWLVAAWLLDALPSQGNMNVTAFVGHSLNAWLVAAPLGALARSFVNGSGAILSIFLVVTLGLGGCFIVGWRLVFALVSRRKIPRHDST